MRLKYLVFFKAIIKQRHSKFEEGLQKKTTILNEIIKNKEKTSVD